MVTARTGLFTSIALVALTLTAAAQPDRIKATTRFTAEGITVITSPAENNLVSVVIGFDGGVASGETDNPVIAEIAGTVLANSGSRRISKDSLRTFLARTSTQITGSGDLRGMTLTMTTPRGNFDEAWKVLTSMILEPAFDPTEFRTTIQRQLANTRERWSRPEWQAMAIADSLLKLTHPVFRHRTTPDDIQALTIPKVEEFAKRIIERSRMLVVLVGGITRQEITERMAPLANLPGGSYTAPAVAPVMLQPRPQVEVADRPNSPTTYVYAAFPGPRMDDPAYWPMAVGLRHLRDVLFEEIRTKRNLSYAPGGFLGAQLGVGVGYLTVSSTLPDSSIHVIYRELEKMRRGEFTEQDLEDTKQSYLTGYYMGQMTNASRASNLYNAERNGGGWRSAYSYDAINAVSKKAVQAAFQTYAKNLAVGVVGTAQQVTQAEYSFRE